MNDEIVATIEDLIARVASGEITSGAVRVFNADGTSRDIVFGTTETAKATALEALRAELARKMH